MYEVFVTRSNQIHLKSARFQQNNYINGNEKAVKPLFLLHNAKHLIDKTNRFKLSFQRESQSSKALLADYAILIKWG